MNKKKTVIITVMLVVMSIMAIGYSYFVTRLNINATGSIDSSWNVYFSKIEVGTKSSGASTKSTPSVSNTTANMDVSLKSPGDYINFNITLVNGGSVDAIIEDIEATAEGTETIIFSISGIKIGDKLAGGSNASKVITIKMEYDSSITSQPSNLTKKLTVNIDAVQDIGQSITPTDPDANQTMLLSAAILRDNNGQSDANIDFSKSSSEDGTKGLYYTNENTEGNNPTYYFRGDVENNYVQFGKGVGTFICTYQGKPVYDFAARDGNGNYEYASADRCLVTPVALDINRSLFGGNDYYVVAVPEEICIKGEDYSCLSEMATLSELKDMYWRIVRINEDGSIRLIYSGDSVDATGVDATIGSERFTLENYDNAGVGYMYGTKNATGENAYELTHTNDNPNLIKKYIDHWYVNGTNLSSFRDTHLADAGFCNDRSLASGVSVDDLMLGDTALGYGNEMTFYGVYYRLVRARQLQFKCPNEERDLFTTNSSNKGNKALTNPIGLITADEATYAGGVFNTTNSNYYLNIDMDYWTMSPMHVLDGPAMWGVGNNGSLYELYNNSWSPSYGVRPVINLKPGVGIVSGNGTKEFPYIIK